MVASSLVATVAFAAPANASCSGPFPTPGGPDRTSTVARTIKVAPLRYEYYESCNVLRWMDTGIPIYLICSYVNTYNNTWWYVTAYGEPGWVYRGNLGSNANRSAATDC